jgi:hypothetical protein
VSILYELKTNIILIFCSVVTNFLFAHQVDVLSDEKKAAAVRHNTHELLLGVHVNKHFKWIPDFLESLPKSISKNIMPPGLIDLMALLGVSTFLTLTKIYIC